MDINNIESNIVEEIVSSSCFSYDIPKKEFEAKILDEIKSANYLKEEWQMQYAKERIIKMIKNKLTEDGTIFTLKPFHYGKRFLIFLIVGGLISSVNSPLFNVLTGFLDIIILNYLVFWITAGIYKKQNKENQFGKAKKVITIFFIIFYILLAATFIKITIQ